MLYFANILEIHSGSAKQTWHNKKVQGKNHAPIVFYMKCLLFRKSLKQSF